MSSTAIPGGGPQGPGQEASGQQPPDDGSKRTTIICRYAIAIVSLVLLNAMCVIVDGEFKNMAVILDFTATAGFLATIGVHVTGPWQ